LREVIDKWRQLGTESPTRRILKAMVTVFSVTSIVKVLGAAKVLLVARFYGTSDDLDAYLIAFVIPSFFADAIAGATSSALIPVYVETRAQSGAAGARRLLGNVVFLCLAICLGLMVAVWVASDSILALIASGFHSEKLALTKSLLRVMVVILLFGGLGSIWKSVLNSMDRFALPAAVTVITPFATMAAVSGVWLAGGKPDGFTLAYGTVVGACLECLFIGWRIVKAGVSPLPVWSGGDRATAKLIEQYWPVTVGSLVAGSAAYVNIGVAASLGAGSVAALNYGTRVLNLVLAIGPGAMGVAMLPHFSALVAEQRWVDLRKTLSDYRRSVLLIAVPVTAVLVIASALLVRVLFEHGQFTGADTEQVADVQRLALLQIPFAILSVILAKLTSSLKTNQSLLGGAVASLAVNLILNYALTPYLGVAGIALATSAAACVYYCYLSHMLFRRGW